MQRSKGSPFKGPARTYTQNLFFNLKKNRFSSLLQNTPNELQITHYGYFSIADRMVILPGASFHFQSLLSQEIVDIRIFSTGFCVSPFVYSVIWGSIRRDFSTRVASDLITLNGPRIENDETISDALTTHDFRTKKQKLLKTMRIGSGWLFNPTKIP